jgi:glycogen operon protein
MRGHAVWPGKPYPLGATLTPEGVNFAIFSAHATAVQVCLFESPGAPNESTKLRLTDRTDGVWHGFLPGLRAGQCYGFRINGPYRPQHGHRFNSGKLLLDPYAKAITGAFTWCNEMHGYTLGEDPDRDLKRDLRDNAWAMPKCVVIDHAFDWEGDALPSTPMADTIIYETHVRGFSMRHPEIPQHLRGTYAALGTESAIAHFRKLGVTAVELLPVHHFVNDHFLEERNLANYWGYNSIGYFAPHWRYSASGAAGEQVTEFKQMVKALHRAGIEVILDVVYNHTGEGSHFGPTFCFRGVDNASYYWPVPDNPRHVMDYTGCGNTLHMTHPRVLQLIMDSLRYWVTEMHVDGFRFDLASTLGREHHGFDRGSSFFDIIRQDPILARVKLIAEPWDVGLGGYQVGNFPEPFAEWNGKYRDCLRAYWKGDTGMVGEFAHRITGSSDLYHWDNRPPAASVNFVTAHDGFTLADLVSYNEKHNEANGEENRDGDSHNRSWNCGAEGETADEAILALRRRQMRNFMTTLLLSQGVPMITAGDEYGRSQGGNNNAYCQDNELSWLQWDRTPEQQRLQDFTARLIAFRREHPIFRRRKFFSGRRIPRVKVKDIIWVDADGTEMTESDWNSPYIHCLGVVFVGYSSDVRDERGQPFEDATFMLLFNAYHDPVKFVLAGQQDVRWERLIDTREETGFLDTPTPHAAGDEFEVDGRSMCVLRLALGTSEAARSAAWKPREHLGPEGP